MDEAQEAGGAEAADSSHTPAAQYQFYAGARKSPTDGLPSRARPSITYRNGTSVSGFAHGTPRAAARLETKSGDKLRAIIRWRTKHVSESVPHRALSAWNDHAESYYYNNIAQGA